MPNHLAQINVARLIAPLDDPRIHGFVSQLATVNGIAEASPGFVWRDRDATGIQFNGDALTVVNISVWDSVESLKAFTYRTIHLESFRGRREWFEKPSSAHYCLWWIPAGHVPGIHEARAKLELLRTTGPTPEAFRFSEA